MQRITFDVPRWHIFQHRGARKLPLVETDDSPQLRFEDELFDRLYSNASPEVVGDANAAWTQVGHAAATELVDSVAAHTRGNVENSALATTWILELAQNEINYAQERAARDVTDEEYADHLAALGLEHVQMSSSYSDNVSRDRRVRSNGRRKQELAQHARDNRRLRHIAMLAGRLKETEVARHRNALQKSVEVVSVEVGDDLARLIPVELVKFANPLLRTVAMRNLVERNLQQYEVQSSTVNKLARGPMVVCIDKSGSMYGEKDVWASAVALALLDIASTQKRVFSLLMFDTRVFHQSTVRPGDGLPVADLLIEPDPEAGTDLYGAFDRALTAISCESAVKNADVIMISDGWSHSSGVPKIRSRAATLGAAIYGIAIGANDLIPWCDEAHLINSFEDLSGEAVSKMAFGKTQETS